MRTSFKLCRMTLKQNKSVSKVALNLELCQRNEPIKIVCFITPPIQFGYSQTKMPHRVFQQEIDGFNKQNVILKAIHTSKEGERRRNDRSLEAF